MRYLIFLLLTVVPLHTALLCPSDIDPCTCNQPESAVACIGSTVTNHDLEIVFEKLKTSNNAGNGKWLNLTRFDMHETARDLLYVGETFEWVSFGVLNVSKNPFLRDLQAFCPEPKTTRSPRTKSPTIVKPADQLLVSRIAVENLAADGCEFSEYSLGWFLSIPAVEASLRTLSVRNNMFNEATGAWKDLKNLEHLSLSGNRITTIGQHHFENLVSLKTLDLSHNKINLLWDRDFAMNTPKFGNADQVLTIDLSFNQLSGEGIQDSTAFQDIKRPVHLLLGNNNFVSVKQKKFLPFLLHNRENTVDFSGNKVVCDSSMDWFKTYAAQLKEQVCGLECLNATLGYDRTNQACLRTGRRHHFNRSDTLSTSNLYKLALLSVFFAVMRNIRNFSDF